MSKAVPPSIFDNLDNYSSETLANVVNEYLVTTVPRQVIVEILQYLESYEKSPFDSNSELAAYIRQELNLPLPKQPEIEMTKPLQEIRDALEKECARLRLALESIVAAKERGCVDYKGCECWHQVAREALSGTKEIK